MYKTIPFFNNPQQSRPIISWSTVDVPRGTRNTQQSEYTYAFPLYIVGQQNNTRTQTLFSDNQNSWFIINITI